MRTVAEIILLIMAIVHVYSMHTVESDEVRCWHFAANIVDLILMIILILYKG